MSDVSYYVKIRGRVVGPFAPERLVQMVQQGRLNRVHMLSTDGDHWQRASEFPEFFELPIAAQPKTAEVSEQATPAEQPPAESEWHYEIDNQSVGPVAQSAIIGLIASGRLQPNSLVWNPGLDDWLAIENVPVFANQSPQSMQAKIQTHNDSSADSGIEETAHIIRSQNNWVYFVFIFLYVAAAGLFFMFIIGLIQGAQTQNGILITQAIFSLVQMVIVVFAAVFLNRYASASSRFIVLKDVKELNTALTWLGRFWLVVGIVLIVWLVLVLILIVYVFALGGALLAL